MNFLDVGPLELMVIVVVALVVFGPDKLPTVIGEAGRWIRRLRGMADDVTREFTRELNLADAHKPEYTYTPPTPLPPPPVYTPPISGPSITKEIAPLRSDSPLAAVSGYVAEPPKPTAPRSDSPLRFVSGYTPEAPATNGVKHDEPATEAGGSVAYQSPTSEDSRAG